MKHTARLLTILSILCLFGLFICGTALAIHDPSNNIYDISVENITISKNSGSTALNVTGSLGGVLSDSISYTDVITIIDSANAETDNVIVINGTDLAGTLINIRIENLNINSSNGAAFSLTNTANVSLTLSGTNTLKSGTDTTDVFGYAGLVVPLNCVLLITSPDPILNTLQVTGGNAQGLGGSGAGIGGSGTVTTGMGAGNIEIQYCTITAIGGNSTSGGSGSGIGGGGGRQKAGTDPNTGGSALNLVIDECIINANGGSSGLGGSGSGIGGGGSGGGSSSANAPQAGGIANVKITGSTVNSTGGKSGNGGGGGSGIGGGGGGYGADRSASTAISGGQGGSGTIVIENSTVRAIGDNVQTGAGTGSGIGGGGGGGGGNHSLPIGSEFTGGNGGNGGAGTSITIKDSTVYSLSNVSRATGSVVGAGSGIGGGGGGRAGIRTFGQSTGTVAGGVGGAAGTISIDNSRIYSCGGGIYNNVIYGSGIGGGESGLTASGGGYYTSFALNSGGVGGTVSISGADTEVVVLYGGIGSGSANVAKGNVYITNDNVLILSDQLGNADFFNVSGGVSVLPITFLVLADSNGAILPDADVSTDVGGGTHIVHTRLNPADLSWFPNPLPVPAGFPMVPMPYDSGIATMWLPVNSAQEFTFSFPNLETLIETYEVGAGDSIGQTLGKTNAVIEIRLKEAASNNGGGGGGGTGGGTIIDPDSGNNSGGGNKIDNGNNSGGGKEIDNGNNSDGEKENVLPTPDQKVSKRWIIFIWLFAIAVGIIVIYLENKKTEN